MSRLMGRCILVSGGAGYIGSHTVVELITDGYVPIVIDNCPISATSRVSYLIL